MLGNARVIVVRGFIEWAEPHKTSSENLQNPHFLLVRS